MKMVVNRGITMCRSATMVGEVILQGVFTRQSQITVGEVGSP